MIYLYRKPEYTPITNVVPSTIVPGDKIVFAFRLDDLFTEVKSRTAKRARFARGENVPAVTELAVTSDDRDTFDDRIRIGSSEVEDRLSGWARDIPAAYRHDVNFGEVNTCGIIDLVNVADLTDEGGTLTVDELKDKMLIITSPGMAMNLYKVISGNSADVITLVSAFDVDVTGCEYIITDKVEKYLLFYLNFDYWDVNSITSIEKYIQEALVSFVAKEWFLINGFMDHFGVEESLYERALTGMTMKLCQRVRQIKRGRDML